MPGLEDAENKEVKQFSNDRRTYTAAKIIPGYATLIYMAVTNTPEDGWDHDGFAKLATYVPDVKGTVDKVLNKFKENQEAKEKSTTMENSKIADKSEEGAAGAGEN